MKIGIDWGGVYGKYPTQFNIMIKLFSSWGHEIHLISGISGEEKVTKRTALAKDMGIFDMIAVHDDTKHTDTDKHKGKYCAEVGIDIMFDDNEGYIADIKRWSPDTKIIKVK